MREIHQGLPMKDFSRPSSGIIDVTVCAKSGLLKTPACNEGEVTLPFLEGTQPVQYCTTHGSGSFTAEAVLQHMEGDAFSLDQDSLLDGLAMPSLPAEFRLPARSPYSASGNRSGSGRRGSAARPSPGIPGENSPAASSGAASSGAVSSGGTAEEEQGEEEPLYLPDYGLELPLYNPLME
jgi:penicillin-binding protein 1A